jgi:hypothetical protein
MVVKTDQRAADPPPDEIRDLCEEIRCGWTVHEERKRAAWSNPGPWTVPEVGEFLSAEVDHRSGAETE